MMENELGIFVKDEQIVVSTRDIADRFNKKHRDVLKAIRELGCDEDFRLRNFAQSKYKNQQNHEMPEYLVTRDGFTLLAMGFTGRKATEWKVKYIKVFNAMERALKNSDQLPPQPQYNIPKSFAEALSLASELEGKRAALAARNEVLEAKAEKTEPKAEAWDKLCSAQSSHLVGEVAKAFGYKPLKLFELLREEKILYKSGSHNYPFQKYIDNGSFEVMYSTKVISGKAENLPVPRVTDKGLELIRGVLARRGIFAISA